MALESQRVVQVIHGSDILKHVEPNDFVISMRSFQGGIEWCGLRGSISSAYVMLIPSSEIYPAFFRYLLKSQTYIQALQSTTNLVRDGQALRYENFTLVDLPIVPICEQVQIATFLDRETTKIDSLVTEQQKLIALLKEKRQAVISHAVTKGLDPTVPMKKSGVEWLGQVPAHWTVRTLKHIVSTPITDGPHETPDFPDEGIPFVSAEAVSSGRIDFTKIRGFISEADHLKYSKKYRPQIGDIYMVKSGATTGITAIVETDRNFNIWSPLAAIRCSEIASPYFVLNFMRSRNFQEAVTLNWSFGTQQNIGMGVIENLAVPIPPLVEQVAIADRLGHLAGQFEELMNEASKAITLLQERRIALISAAVTGKIDVREAVAVAEEVA